jgi:uncharacterized membrane protein
MWLSSLGLGAATAFFLDPTSGNRRRRRIGDGAVHLTHQVTQAASTVGRDLKNRTRGIVAAARHRIRPERPDDVVLEERVHAALGRVVSHPHAITVQVHDGHVTLDGPILAAEEHRLVSAVRALARVKDVETRFDRHIQPATSPSLPGGPLGSRMPPRPDILQRNWAPATRTIVAGSGVALVGAGAMRRDPTGLGLAAAGAALVARAATNMPFRRIVGIGAERRAIDVQKTITVDLPVDRVFAFWENPVNLPTIMRHVREVRATREPHQWHWTVSGPAPAVPIEFDTVVTDRVENRVLAWKTTDDSVVRHAGLIRFDRVGDRPSRGIRSVVPERTRLQIRLSYDPPGRALAHRVLSLLGADPKSRLDEDLVRMKTALETGHRAHDVAVRS